MVTTGSRYDRRSGKERKMTLGANFRSDPGPLLPVKLLGREDICVLIVTHYDNPEGRIRTRRLFANINRNAVKTSATEDIVLDEDDGFAVLARRMLDDQN